MFNVQMAQMENSIIGLKDAMLSVTLRHAFRF